MNKKKLLENDTLIPAGLIGFVPERKKVNVNN